MTNRLTLRVAVLGGLLGLAVPAQAEEAKGVAVVTALTGKADLKRPQAPQIPLKLRDNLYVRDVVDTQQESLARILLLGKATVTVRELSRFEIREETRPDGSQRVLINLAEGKIRVMVARRLMKPGDEVEIRTPNAIAGVRGSDGVIEVSQLPDGRPLTVITGASGEFQVTLPTTPPFITKEKEFLDGPALAGGAPGALMAMAETASDAGAGARVAQGPGLSVTALVQAQITGFAGAQTLAQALLTQMQLGQVLGNYQINLGATGATHPPPAATERIVNTGVAIAQAAAFATGLAGAVPSVPTGPTTFTPTGLAVITPTTTSTTTSTSGGTPVIGATSFFAQLSPGQQNLAQALRQADLAQPPPPPTRTLEQLAQQRLQGTNFSKVFDEMKSQGAFSPSIKNLGQVISDFCKSGSCSDI